MRVHECLSCTLASLKALNPEPKAGTDESHSDFQHDDSALPGTSTGRTGFKLHELSGQSRALLKECFETTEAFRLPLGHPTVAFSETQLYNLLRILTNETMSLTYNTMEKMVLDAVRGQPTTSQSCTDHFRYRTKSQTPGRGARSDSSFETESESEVSGRPLPEVALERITSCEESDGATETALISLSFQKSTNVGPSTSASGSQPTIVSPDEMGSSEFASQDVTLSEIRDQTRSGKYQEDPPAKKTEEDQKGVPQRRTDAGGVLSKDWLDEVLHFRSC